MSVVYTADIFCDYKGPNGEECYNEIVGATQNHIPPTKSQARLAARGGPDPEDRLWSFKPGQDLCPDHSGLREKGPDIG